MYYCHTCNFANGEGVCVNCVKNCHSKHVIKYAGFVNGFCDCGAKVNGSCRVLISGEKSQKMQSISRKNVQVIKLCKTFTIGTQTQEYKASTYLLFMKNILFFCIYFFL